MSNLNTTETFGVKRVHPDIVCKGCKYANGEKPFADMPTKMYCMVYDRESGHRKPTDVYYDGKECRYFKEK